MLSGAQPDGRVGAGWPGVYRGAAAAARAQVHPGAAALEGQRDLHHPGVGFIVVFPGNRINLRNGIIERRNEGITVGTAQDFLETQS